MSLSREAISNARTDGQRDEDREKRKETNDEKKENRSENTRNRTVKHADNSVSLSLFRAKERARDKGNRRKAEEFAVALATSPPLRTSSLAHHLFPVSLAL